ncbi:MAG: hypothetical protein E6K56_04750 [Ignavibacteria bacterium]|nr:MAG: hypothetical protein E6K56_04750 [Ignavibacteria bacterium]
MTQSLAVSGTNLFAGTYYGGVFRTTDNGTNWTAVNTGLPDPEIFSLAASGTKLFAGTYLGVSRSTDNGTSWTPTGVHNIIYALTASGPFVFAGKHSGGVFRSTNNGTSWTSVNTGFSDTTVYSLAILSPNLVVGTYIGAFRSANNGASWTATSLTNTSVLSLAFAPNGAGGSNLFTTAQAGPPPA